METIIEFFNHILDVIRDLPDTSDTYWERVIGWGIVLYFEVKLAAIEFAYAVASTIMSALNLSQVINMGWSALDSQTLGVLTYLRIPESINMILSAFVTRFVLDLLP